MVDEHILLIDVKARVDAVWEQMNKGASNSVLQSLCRKRASNPKENKQKSSSVSTSFFFFFPCHVLFSKEVMVARCFLIL